MDVLKWLLFFVLLTLIAPTLSGKAKKALRRCRRDNRILLNRINNIKPCPTTPAPTPAPTCPSCPQAPTCPSASTCPPQTCPPTATCPPSPTCPPVSTCPPLTCPPTVTCPPSSTCPPASTCPPQTCPPTVTCPPSPSCPPNPNCSTCPPTPTCPTLPPTTPVPTTLEPTTVPPVDLCSICGTIVTAQSSQVEFVPSIIGGTDTAPNEFPSYAFVLTERPNGFFSCGGSVITSTFVITAAHCADDTPIRMIVLLDRYDSTVSHTGPRETVLRIIVHPAWNTNNLSGGKDIALLEINAQTFTASVRPICLPRDDSDQFANLVACAIGFGQTGGPSARYLKKGELTVITNAVCRNTYGLGLADEIICAIHAANSICFGDSGGGLIKKTDANGMETRILIGISSFVGDNDCIGPANAFTRVSKYLSWIRGHTGLVTCPPPV